MKWKLIKNDYLQRSFIFYKLQCGDISFQEYLRLISKITKHTMSIDEIISILNSYKRNETIQYYDAALNEWLDIKDYNQLLYHIANGVSLKAKKPQRYYPYENAQEFLADSKIHGPYVKNSIGTYIIPNRIEYNRIEWSCAHNNSFNRKLFTELLSDGYKWADEAPVGKLKNEL